MEQRVLTGMTPPQLDTSLKKNPKVRLFDVSPCKMYCKKSVIGDPEKILI